MAARGRPRCFVALGLVAAVGLTVGAILLVARRDSWRVVTGVGAAVSLAQLFLFFASGLFVGVGINLAILVAVAWTYRSTADSSRSDGVSDFGPLTIPRDSPPSPSLSKNSPTIWTNRAASYSWSARTSRRPQPRR